MAELVHKLRFCWKEATELVKCTVFEKHMALLIIPMFIATIVASLIDLSFGPGMIRLLVLVQYVLTMSSWLGEFNLTKGAI